MVCRRSASASTEWDGAVGDEFDGAVYNEWDGAVHNEWDGAVDSEYPDSEYSDTEYPEPDLSEPMGSAAPADLYEDPIDMWESDVGDEIAAVGGNAEWYVERFGGEYYGM